MLSAISSLHTVDWITLFLAASTLILAVATIFLALDTKKMAVLADKQHDLSSRPYLAMEKDIEFRVPEVIAGVPVVETNRYSVAFRLRNVGNVPLRYKVESMKCSDESMIHDRVEYLLYPQQIMDLWTAEILTECERRVERINDRLEISLSYWASEVPEKKYLITRKLQLEGRKYRILNDYFSLAPRKQGKAIKIDRRRFS